MASPCPPAGGSPAAASAGGPRDRSGIWLGTAAAGLAVLAGAAAAVSFSAQYQMVHAARGLPVVAALEAAIPDTAALIFASLGIALALHGRRAVRSRLLNLAAVGTSVAMNVLAAAPGWRSLAIWAMPPARRGPRCARQSWLRRTGASGDHLPDRSRRGAAGAGVRGVGVPARQVPARQPVGRLFFANFDPAWV